jgi:hypothetical protein
LARASATNSAIVLAGEAGGTQISALLTPTMAIGLKSAMASNGARISRFSTTWPDTVR